MTRLATLAGADPHRPGIRVEVRDRHSGQLAISATGQQRSCNQRAEIRRAGVHETACFVVREITEPSRVSLAEGADSAPRVIAGAAPFPVRVVERGLED